jgi:hypothetical protein
MCFGGQVWWQKLIILVTWEVKVGGSHCKTSPGTLTLRAYLKNKLKIVKGTTEWLK